MPRPLDHGALLKTLLMYSINHNKFLDGIKTSEETILEVVHQNPATRTEYVWIVDVVYFDQCLGDAQPKRWSKSLFSWCSYIFKRFRSKNWLKPVMNGYSLILLNHVIKSFSLFINSSYPIPTLIIKHLTKVFEDFFAIF